MIKKTFILTMVFLAIVAAGMAYYFSQIKDTYKLTASFENVSNVSLIQADDFRVGELNEIKGVIKDSGDTIRLKKDRYVAVYEPADGYKGGEIKVDLTLSDQQIDINPSFSKAKLDEMLKPQIPVIHSAIKQNVKGVNEYLIQHGELYEFGDWYGTTLIYNGQDYYNADSLRIVLKKNDGKWTVVTPFPDIIISKYYYPDIPLEVLDGVNAQEAPIQSKYNY